jgi:NAD(P)-dependent dehydrogenase (short-subunit alcohol dehydrogenase family)
MNRLVLSDLKNKTCVITGGSGLIGSAICEELARRETNLAIIGLDENNASDAASELSGKTGAKIIGMSANVLDKSSLLQAKEKINGELGSIDILINCAGGNNPRATTRSEMLFETDDTSLCESFFGLDIDDLKQVTDLNLYGTVLSSLVFGTDMAKKKSGAILNISSMAAYSPLTRVPAYSAAKAAVNNFTQWLAAHLAKMNIRVNAIAPGFIVTTQNEFLLLKNKNGDLTDRGKKIIEHTPMGRFGCPDDICGAALFLVSDMSAFITGVVIPVDGGFNAYAGV